MCPHSQGLCGHQFTAACSQCKFTKYTLIFCFDLACQFGDSWQPKVPGATEDDEEADTFIQAVNMLWNLWWVLTVLEFVSLLLKLFDTISLNFFSESNTTALRYFNQSNLLPLLVRCLDVNTFGIDVAISVGKT